MFYDNSEEVFPNWWDALDGASDSGPVGDTCLADHAGVRQVDRDGVVLQTGSSEAVDAPVRGDQEEGPTEQDNGPLSPDGYRYPGLNDPHISEACEASESSESSEASEASGASGASGRNGYMELVAEPEYTRPSHEDGTFTTANSLKI